MSIDIGPQRSPKTVGQISAEQKIAARALAECDRITPEWLDSCGVPKSMRGSVLVVYQVGCLGMLFKDGVLRTSIGGCQMFVKTRDQLRSLVEMMGCDPLQERPGLDDKVDTSVERG